MEKMIEWALNVLTEKGYLPLEAPKTLRSMPWSTVLCFQTSKGKVFLKSMAQCFSYEPALLSFLTQQKVHHLPSILATHKNNHCFLMEDAGDPLLPILKANYDVSMIKQALKTYAELQLKCIPFVDHLISIGVMDFRLNELPTLFESFLEDSELGFKLEDLENLRKSKKAFENMCQALGAIGIPETLEQGDFTDENILIKNYQITFNDFGDASITHPFFSIAAFLNSAENAHHLNPSSQKYLNFRDIYLNEWKDYASHDKLIQGFEIANTLIPFVWALGLKRIKSCPGIEVSEYNVYVEKVLKHYYTTFNALTNHVIRSATDD